MRTLLKSTEYNVIRYQLIKSSTSSGADFHNKVNISLKEMSESNYWLVIIEKIIDSKYDKKELIWLLKESIELDKILGSIVKKTNK